MKYYLSVLKKYAVFSGRASRAEYWYFHLFNFIIFIGLSLIEFFIKRSLGIPAEIGKSFLVNIYYLATAIPLLAVSVRRMHDVNKSGWFIFVPIYSFILTVTSGTKGDNKYGPDPKVTEVIQEGQNI